MPSLSTTRIQHYLDDLDRALRHLPRDRRQEIAHDVRSHIEAALADAKDQGSQEVESIIERLGTPEEIAAAASDDQPEPSRGMAGRDVAAIIFLLIGGLVIPLVGWLVGAVLLWTSAAWRLKDKLIATLLLPGGLATPAALLALGVRTSSSSCGGSTQAPVPVHSPAVAQDPVSSIATTCTHSGSSGHVGLAVLFLVVGVAAPLFSTWWLIRHARRPGPMSGN